MSQTSPQFYRHTIDISTLSLDDIDRVLEEANGIARGKVDFKKKSLEITYEVGPDGVSQDLWDLCGEVENLMACIDGYLTGYLDWSKPTQVR